MNRLSFNFTLQPNPYKEEPSSEYEIWGEIVLVLSGESETIEIVTHQWDILEVYEWFQKNKSILPEEAFPFHVEDEKCIANCRDILYGRDDFKELNEEIEYFDTMENYFSNHHFKLKGTDSPMVFIGLKNDHGEISWFDIQKQTYPYFSFDMDSFIVSTQGEFTRLFSQWYKCDERRNSKVMTRIKEMENSTGNHF